MATRGVKQLQSLNIVYCEHGGSSRAVREYLSSSRIIEFAKQNPSVSISSKLRNGCHPYVQANYVTGSDKQVCIKNEPIKRIVNVMSLLNNSSGRKISKIGNPVRTLKPSIQGIWTPMLDIRNTSFDIKFVE
mmetsp:Transcript_911/g.1382  ORF Transcript_911/g.1382 Transcript_911/m.1382 type:complete len:132 (+) Transcript_911:48-443(+)